MGVTPKEMAQSRHKVALTPKQHTQQTTSDCVCEGVSDLRETLMMV